MFFIKRKKVAEKVSDDRELVEANGKAIEALIILSKENQEIIKDLKDLQEEIKYLRPSDSSKVVDCDKTIKNKIGDLRIALTKSDGEVSKKAAEILMDIKLAIADRNTKL